MKYEAMIIMPHFSAQVHLSLMKYNCIYVCNKKSFMNDLCMITVNINCVLCLCSKRLSAGGTFVLWISKCPWLCRIQETIWVDKFSIIAFWIYRHYMTMDTSEIYQIWYLILFKKLKITLNVQWWANSS
jgi:hypothetical protein